MADLATRVLVRLDAELAFTAEEVNEALAHTSGYGRAVSPGVPATEDTLATLERDGLAKRSGNEWRLTETGKRRWDQLETLWDNSGRPGRLRLLAAQAQRGTRRRAGAVGVWQSLPRRRTTGQSQEESPDASEPGSQSDRSVRRNSAPSASELTAGAVPLWPEVRSDDV